MSDELKQPEKGFFASRSDPGSASAPRVDETPIASAPARGTIRDLSFLTLDDDELGVFYVPPELIPHGFEVEWKVVSVLGMQKDSSYMVKLARNGWEPAPIEQFRSMMPNGWTGKNVERQGQMLMMRPKEYSDAIREHERKRAALQTGDKLKSVGVTPSGSFERTTAKVSRTFSVPD